MTRRVRRARKRTSLRAFPEHFPVVDLATLPQLNRYERVQSKLKFNHLFPKPKKGQCKCGCDQPVVHPRRLWASDECSESAGLYYALIKGYQSTVRALVYKRDRGICAYCHSQCGLTNWEADHIVEVVNGGGGCDLDNYQTLCIVCHKEKTKALMKELRKRG